MPVAFLNSALHSRTHDAHIAFPPLLDHAKDERRSAIGQPLVTSASGDRHEHVNVFEEARERERRGGRVLRVQHPRTPLANYFAAHGFVVIQPTHPRLEDAALPQLSSPRCASSGERGAEDMKRILDQLEAIERAVPVIAGRVDRSKVAVLGHSMGGHTASVLLGARHRRSARRYRGEPRRAAHPGGRAARRARQRRRPQQIRSRALPVLLDHRLLDDDDARARRRRRQGRVSPPDHRRGRAGTPIPTSSPWPQVPGHAVSTQGTALAASRRRRPPRPPTRTPNASPPSSSHGGLPPQPLYPGDSAWQKEKRADWRAIRN